MERSATRKDAVIEERDRAVEQVSAVWVAKSLVLPCRAILIFNFYRTRLHESVSAGTHALT